jgi:hypothetical protein
MILVLLEPCHRFMNIEIFDNSNPVICGFCWLEACNLNRNSDKRISIQLTVDIEFNSTR